MAGVLRAVRATRRDREPRRGRPACGARAFQVLSGPGLRDPHARYEGSDGRMNDEAKNREAAADDDLPVLTDIAPDPELVGDGSASDGPVEVISRVQNQNLQHSMYQKLRKDLDGRIAEVVRAELMPDLGDALNSAVQHITQEIKTNLGALVRSSVEQALKEQ